MYARAFDFKCATSLQRLPDAEEELEIAMAMASASASGAITANLSASSRASLASAPIPSLCHISRSWSLPVSWRLHLATEFGSLRLQTAVEEQGRGRRGAVRAAKGFGEVVQRKKKGANAEASKPKGEPLSCPCGGGDDRQEFGDCCARYHGGVVEPDALTLMKARFSAYARSKVDYVVRTTHPDNPEFRGKDELAADVRTTCEQLRFTRLEILGFETPSEDEAFVSFRVTYGVAKGGRAGDKQFLVEKSRFVKEGDRWLYIERIPTSQASEAAWLNSTSNPRIERKSFKSQPGLSPRKS